METKEDLINYALHSEKGRLELAKGLGELGPYSEEYWKKILDNNHECDMILHSRFPEYKPFLSNPEYRIPAIAHTA